MSLTTRHPGHIVIADEPENIIFGTCMLGDAFGTVESCSLKRTSDIEELEKCGGNLLALIMRKIRFEMTLKTIFTDDVDVSIGQFIDFPLAEIVGRVIDITVDWEKAGQRMLSIEAKSFDSLSNYGSGIGMSYSADGGTTTPIDPA